MPTRRVMKSVLESFLGTFTSRYSDYRGYWLLGQLSFDPPEYEFDLLVSPPDGDSPLCLAWRLACRRFHEQVSKAGLKLDVVREASLRIVKQPESVEGWHGAQMSMGHRVQFIAAAVIDNSHRYARQRTVFVAPHDPGKEIRCLPVDWGT